MPGQKPVLRPPESKLMEFLKRGTGLFRVPKEESPRDMSRAKAEQAISERVRRITHCKRIAEEDIRVIYGALQYFKNSGSLDGLKIDMKSFASWKTEKKAIESFDFATWFRYRESIKMLGMRTRFGTTYRAKGDMLYVLKPPESENQYSCPTRPGVSIIVLSKGISRAHVVIHQGNGEGPGAYVDFKEGYSLKVKMDPERVDFLINELITQARIASAYQALTLAEVLNDLVEYLKKSKDYLVRNSGNLELVSDGW